MGTGSLRPLGAIEYDLPAVTVANTLSRFAASASVLSADMCNALRRTSVAAPTRLEPEWYGRVEPLDRAIDCGYRRFRRSAIEVAIPEGPQRGMK